MASPPPEPSPRARGRVLAVLSLLVVVLGIVGQGVIAERLVVAGDAAKSAANIVAHQSLFRLAFSIFVVEMITQIATSALFYDLLKPVDRSLARIAAIIGITGCGIKTLARLFFYAPLILLGGAPFLSAVSPSELATLSLTSLVLNDHGAAIALIFFGVEALLQGLLIYRSGFLPRSLGVLSMVAGLGWLTFLWPPLGLQALVGVALVAIVGVFATSGWLLVRGVDEEKWRARVALASASIWR